nr:hypothetical protein [Nonomuraea sp. SYSU D8015]
MEYARYGPTAGDRIRLADTNLRIEISEDWAGGPGRSGNEVIFGGGKVIRESMGQSCAREKPDAAFDEVDPARAVGRPQRFGPELLAPTSHITTDRAGTQQLIFTFPAVAPPALSEYIHTRQV